MILDLYIKILFKLYSLYVYPRSLEYITFDDYLRSYKEHVYSEISRDVYPRANTKRD